MTAVRYDLYVLNQKVSSFHNDRRRSSAFAELSARCTDHVSLMGRHHNTTNSDLALRDRVCYPSLPQHHPATSPRGAFLSSSFSHHPNRVTRANQRAMADVIERDEPTVIPARGPRRSRLPAPLRVPILIVLNLGIKVLLWQTVANFLPPELGFVSKAPTDLNTYSLYSPLARLVTRILTVYATWALGYDCNTQRSSIWVKHS